MYILRDYQQYAVSQFFSASHGKKIVITACTGAGKSLIIAEIVKRSMVKTLVLVPSVELLRQNVEKFKHYGIPYSIYSASAGSKDLSCDIVFATFQSVAKNPQYFSAFELVIHDECHIYNSTLSDINPKRVLGLTATPYRLGCGYIFKVDKNGEMVNKNAFYDYEICRIGYYDLIPRGYLCDVSCDIHCEQYDFKEEKKYTPKVLSNIFDEEFKKTTDIVKDIAVKTAHISKVIIFASTKKHAYYIKSMLIDSEVVHAGLHKRERDRIINDFKHGSLQYIINLDILTTGFDCPEIGCVCILRPTESLSLFYQMLGRGLRVSKGKEVCYLLDYAGNIERHGLKDDVFSERVEKPRNSDAQPFSITFNCPSCQDENTFSLKKYAEFYDCHGFMVDALGVEVKIDGKKVPAHHGRKCPSCGYRYACKICVKCNEYNDLGARDCLFCGCSLVDQEGGLSVVASDFSTPMRRIAWISVELSKRVGLLVKVKDDLEKIHYSYIFGRDKILDFSRDFYGLSVASADAIVKISKVKNPIISYCYILKEKNNKKILKKC